MYMMRRIHAEGSPEGGSFSVWVYQYERENLNELIALGRRNIDPFKDNPGWERREDSRPDQETLPGCVWQGRCDEVFDSLPDAKVHGITHCMIFNVSKCWYSSVLSRELTRGDNRLLRFNSRIDRVKYPHFDTMKECVDYLSSPEGLWICSDRDIKPVNSTELEEMTP